MEFYFPIINILKLSINIVKNYKVKQIYHACSNHIFNFVYKVKKNEEHHLITFSLMPTITVFLFYSVIKVNIHITKFVINTVFIKQIIYKILLPN